MYIEKNCVIEHNGKQYENGGAVVTDNYLIGYLKSNTKETVGNIVDLTDWHGNNIGKVKITGRWRINSYISTYMISGKAKADGKYYTVRGCGAGMVIKGKLSKNQNW